MVCGSILDLVNVLWVRVGEKGLLSKVKNSQ